MASKDLPRTIGLTTATAIVIGSVIGSGIFKKTAAMTDALPSPSLVIAIWVLAGAVSLVGAFCAAELSAAWPDSGGLYAHLKRILGPFWGFLYGWSTLSVIQTGSIASIAYVFAQYLRFFFHWGDVSPGLAGWGVTIAGVIDLYPLRDLGTKFVAIACIWALTVINIIGVKPGAIVQNVFMYLKFLIMGGIVVIAAFGAGHLMQALGGPVFPAEISPPALGGTASWTTLIGAVAIALSGAFWAYDAWICATYMSAEVKNPQRNMPRALIIGMGAATLSYILVNLAYFHLLSVDEVRSSELVASDALGRVLPVAAAVVAASVVLSTFGAINGTAFSSARVYYALARDGLFFRGLAAVHPRRETPYVALIIQAVWSSLLVFSGTFDQVTDMLIFVSWGFYALLALAVIVGRVRFPHAERPFRTPGYPWLPVIFILFSTAYLVFSVVANTRNAVMGLMLVVPGIPFYIYFNAMNNRKPA